MKTYYSITYSKDFSGKVKKKRLALDESDKMIYRGIMKVIHEILGEEVFLRLTEYGIEIEESDLKKLNDKLKELCSSYDSMSHVIEIMKKCMKKMDEAIKREDPKFNYEYSLRFFGYFFLTAPYYSLFTRKFKKLLESFVPNMSKEEVNKTFLDLITLDKEAYIFEILKELKDPKLVEKHPFIKHIKGDIGILKYASFENRDKKNKRKEALERLSFLSKDKLEALQRWSNLINDMQYILEMKNYYWPKLSELLEK